MLHRIAIASSVKFSDILVAFLLISAGNCKMASDGSNTEAPKAEYSNPMSHKAVRLSTDPKTGAPMLVDAETGKAVPITIITDDSKGTVAKAEVPAPSTCSTAARMTCKVASLFALAAFAAAALLFGLSIGLTKSPNTETKSVDRTVVEPLWGEWEAEAAGWHYDHAFDGLNSSTSVVIEGEEESGPEHWGDLTDSNGNVLYPMCKDTANSQQTPIDLAADSFPASAPSASVAPYTFNINSTAKYQIVSRPGGHPGFQVKPLPGGQPSGWIIDGDNYTFLQLHFHSPSEHTIDGKSLPLEVHLVHQKVGSTGTNDLAVFGILYDYSSDDSSNTVLDSWWTNIQRPVPLVDSVSLAAMIAQAGPVYYRYPGSLTTPPCAEGVKWHVQKSTVGINSMQETIFIAAMRGLQNNRPTQPLHGRTVTTYRQA